jgi:hypothetical protein
MKRGRMKNKERVAHPQTSVVAGQLDIQPTTYRDSEKRFCEGDIPI